MARTVGRPRTKQVTVINYRARGQKYSKTARGATKYLLRNRPSYGLKGIYNEHRFCVKHYNENLFSNSWTAPAGITDTNEDFRSIQFRLNQLINSTKLTVLYDQYRIDKVKIQIMPQSTESYEVRNAGGAVSIFPGIIYIVEDFDDVTPATTMDEMVCRKNSKRAVLDKPVTYSIRPMVAVSEIDGVTSNTFRVPTKPQWIDCNAPNIDHLGFKICIQNSFSSQSTLPANIEVVYPGITTFWISMRTPRLS
jgi:hypothetical protein